MAEEMLGAYLVIQSSGDLQYMPEWEHLTDSERQRAVRALDGVFDLFQDDEAFCADCHGSSAPRRWARRRVGRCPTRGRDRRVSR